MVTVYAVEGKKDIVDVNKPPAPPPPPPKYPPPFPPPMTKYSETTAFGGHATALIACITSLERQIPCATEVLVTAAVDDINEPLYRVDIR
jgi:hypothetical protein